jgi:putative transcriptional regulator
MIAHHPTEDVLLGYAAGDLSEPMALVVATHLTLCPSCRRAVADAELLAGALLDQVALEPANDHAAAAPWLSSEVDAVIARAARTPQGIPQGISKGVSASAARPVAKAGGLFPRPLAQYVGGDLDQVAWKPLAPGIRHSILAQNAEGATVRLLRIEPGRSVFEHSHTGTEMTLVLCGSYEAGGQRFARGDLEVADETVLHKPVAGMEDVCVCLAVTDAPLRFRSVVGRVMQPFFGI